MTQIAAVKRLLKPAMQTLSPARRIVKQQIPRLTLLRQRVTRPKVLPKRPRRIQMTAALRAAVPRMRVARAMPTPAQAVHQRQLTQTLFPEPSRKRRNRRQTRSLRTQAQGIPMSVKVLRALARPKPVSVRIVLHRLTVPRQMKQRRQKTRASALTNLAMKRAPPRRNRLSRIVRRLKPMMAQHQRTPTARR